MQKYFFFSQGLFKNVQIFLCIKAARCDCCKSQGTLKEKVQWRGEMKHFCDQHCLLRFYCQQNEPNLATQKGPENLHYGMCCFMAAKWQTGCFLEMKNVKVHELFMCCNKLCQKLPFFILSSEASLRCLLFLSQLFSLLLFQELKHCEVIKQLCNHFLKNKSFQVKHNFSVVSSRGQKMFSSFIVLWFAIALWKHFFSKCVLVTESR